MKQKVTVNIDSEVYQRSKQLGVNVSQACTNYLKLLNNQIEGLNGETNGFLGKASFTKEGLVRLPGFEPGSSTWQNGVIAWEKFREFVEKDHRPKVARQLFNNAQRYCTALTTRDLSAIQALDDTMRPNAMGALSSLSKFLGVHDEFKQLVKNYGLKWTGKSGDDIFIERLTNISDSEEIWTWIKSAKEARPELCAFLDLLAFTGLRLSEGLASYNLQIRLSSEGTLNTYYATEKNILEHYRFKEMFIRRSKKAFISFVPGELVKEITDSRPYVSTDAVQKMLQKRGLSLRFADVREAHGTFMNKYLKREEIDVLHGRVTSSVFMQHYFNPALIGDLKERAFKGIAEIQNKTKIS